MPGTRSSTTFDDDVWNVPQGNPMKWIFGQLQDLFDPCVEQAHLMTVSTRGLASAVDLKLGYLKKPVMVVPNAVDMRIFRDYTVQKNDDYTVIGWAGTNTHMVDVKECWHILPDVVKEFDKVKMEFIGLPPPREIYGHPRVMMRPGYPVGEYPGRLASWGWDIALGPLEQHRFNVSKSAIRLMEVAVAKTPTLCSDVAPYRDFCSLGGEDLKWLLCSFESQWKQKLRRLVMEPDWRKHLGQLAYNVVDRFFNLKDKVNNWKYAAQAALEQN